MCRNVADCAAILNYIACPDPLDTTTLSQPTPVPDYSKTLNTDALRGVRLGVPRFFMNKDIHMKGAFDVALEIIRRLGATIVDPADFPEPGELRKAKLTERLVMKTDFKVRWQCDGPYNVGWTSSQVDIGQYLEDLAEVPTQTRTLADLIKFNIDNADRELLSPNYDDQSQWALPRALFLLASANYHHQIYCSRKNQQERRLFFRAEIQRANKPGKGNRCYSEEVQSRCSSTSYWWSVSFIMCILFILTNKHNLQDSLPRQRRLLDILLLQVSWTLLSACHITYSTPAVPLGFQPGDLAPGSAEPTRQNGPGVPFGISFIGTAWTEFQLIGFAYAYEQATKTRLKRLAYPEAIPKAQLKDFIRR
jgi:amidase